MNLRPSLFVVPLVMSFGTVDLGATEQIPEEVVVGKQVFSFYSYPLEQLITTEEFLKKYGLEPSCSAAWRGYKGSWLISSGELFLGALIANPCRFEERKRSHDLAVILPDYDIRQYYYKANWFTGEIVIPISEVRAAPSRKTQSGHSYYEHETIVYKIESGDVVSRTIEYREW